MRKGGKLEAEKRITYAAFCTKLGSDEEITQELVDAGEVGSKWRGS
jgi:hypothetical protein